MPALLPSNSAKLDTKIELQRRTATRSATTGAQLTTWETYATVWAEIEEATSARAPDERLDQDVALYGRPQTVKIRWRAGVMTGDRIRYVEDGEERLLQLVGTAAIGRRRWLQLAIREWSNE